MRPSATKWGQVLPNEAKCDQMKFITAIVHLDSLLIDSIAVVSFMCYVVAHRLIHVWPLTIAASGLALVTPGHIWSCLGFIKLVYCMATLAQSWTLDSNIAVNKAPGNPDHRPGIIANAHTNQLHGNTIGLHFAHTNHRDTFDLQIQALEFISPKQQWESTGPSPPQGEILDTETQILMQPHKDWTSWRKQMG